ncbi:MAG: DUF488 domain-containing protein [Helicobacteraceae bacterium]|jgi:uncharacterized protein (DUF488 family)|nr:DUF488 domain-containing protein [Helicobacteraceae bacterium]
MNNIYTIGFAGKGAEKFFTLLKNSGAKRLIDIRLNNLSQLAAFSKKDDLRYFLKTILDWEYIHKPELVPTESILSDYKNKKIDWKVYEERFKALVNERKVFNLIKKSEMVDSVLLCSEPEPKFCHRRLVAEHFAEKLSDVKIAHL